MTDHLSLVELNQLIKQALSAQLQPTYWVVAEIGELRVAQNGHCYLDLVEKGDDRLLAKVRATIWAYTFRNLQGWFESVTGEALRPGLKILAQVEVQFHELYGLSFNVKDIDAQYTLGERARRRREVIQQLIDEGVYEMNKALPLPLVPQRVAVISSPTAAGLGDFMDQLQRNRGGYRFEVQLFKASMQGDAAEASIVAALLAVYDCLEQRGPVLRRGGGNSRRRSAGRPRLLRYLWPGRAHCAVSPAGGYGHRTRARRNRGRPGSPHQDENSHGGGRVPDRRPHRLRRAH